MLSSNNYPKLVTYFHFLNRRATIFHDDEDLAILLPGCVVPNDVRAIDFGGDQGLLIQIKSFCTKD
jgi:hypothetical protein